MIFWCCGALNGPTKNGWVGKTRFTSARKSGYPVGVHTVTFDAAYPNTFYIIKTTPRFSGFIKILSIATNNFVIATTNAADQYVDGYMWFQVL